MLGTVASMPQYRFPATNRSATLADWEDLSPTQHTRALMKKAWSPEDGREGLDFYDSTVEYMRNDWAAANLQGEWFEPPGRAGVQLYRYEWPTGEATWHTADAFDIDHIVPAVDHAEALGASNYAEANIAYNDVGNLRLLPSAANRSGYFNVGLRDGGAPDGWVNQTFGYDSTQAAPMFRPTNRMQATYDTPYEYAANGRRGLSFDNSVKNDWVEGRLRDIHYGDVEAQDGEWVSLFRCEATGQLVTRDALDIDHINPVEDQLRALGTSNRGAALDTYNDVTNLRLVSRSANSSHEWERSGNGEWRDPIDGEDDPDELVADRAFIDDSEADAQELSDAQRDEIRSMFQDPARRTRFHHEMDGDDEEPSLNDDLDDDGEPVERVAKRARTARSASDAGDSDAAAEAGSASEATEASAAGGASSAGAVGDAASATAAVDGSSALSATSAVTASSAADISFAGELLEGLEVVGMLVAL
jgi:hypothetical protein